jgi:hypothetical protein
MFEIGCGFMPGLACTAILPFVLSQVAGMTGTCHCTQPLVEMGFLELFTRASLEP